MPFIFRSIARLTMAAAAMAMLNTCLAALAAGPASATAEEAPFLSENDQAMTKMMDDMSIMPSGDVDHDFVAMMVPHHQGAIDMAQAELRYGRNQRLRRIAQEIVVEQQQEIIAMRLALGQSLPPPAPAPDQQRGPTSVPAPTTPMSPNDTQMRMRKEP
jgi:uncharacterized protein (DUF305 family)